MKNIRQSGRLPKYSSSRVLTSPCESRNCDDRFGVLDDPTCTNVGFSLSCLSREEGIWRKVKTKFSFSHLAVDI